MRCLAFLLLPALAGACARPAPERGREAPARVDTVTAVREAWAAVPAEALDTAVTMIEWEGQRRAGPWYIESVSRREEGLLLVQCNVRRDGTLLTLDSVGLAAGSLAPLWHSDVTPGARMRVTFAGNRMRGIIDSGGRRVPVDRAMPVGALDFSAAITFARLLPLRVGYAAVIRAWDIHRGPVDIAVRVDGEERIAVAGRRVAVYRVVTTTGGRSVTRWIERRGRREVRVRANLAGGTLVMERPR